jgi:hypothetical protein
MEERMKKSTLIVAGLVAGLLLVSSARSQSYSIDWHTIDGGGGTSTGSGFSMNATIGQFGSGPLAGGGYTLEAGFGGASAAAGPVTLFDNTTGENNGAMLATTTSWLAGKLCMGSQSFGLESATLLLSSQTFLGTTQASTVRLQLYANDPIASKPSTNLGVIMNLSGVTNPIFLPLGTEEVRVKWVPATTFTLASNTCYWVVLNVDAGAAVWETASFTLPTGIAATYGRSSSTDAGATWSNPDNANNLKMLVEGNVIPSVPLVIRDIGIFGNALHFSFPTSIGGSYVIESRTGLASGVWAEVPGTLLTSTGAVLEVSLPLSLSQSQQFFRVKQLP